MYKYLLIEKEDGIGILTINRPPMNALCNELEVYTKIANLQVPTIAAVNGFALGAGLELALDGLVSKVFPAEGLPDGAKSIAKTLMKKAPKAPVAPYFLFP